MTHLTKLSSSFFLAVFTCFSLLAQTPKEELIGISERPYSPAPAIKMKKSASSLQLPFFDDFSYNLNRPVDSLWMDDNVYVNQTFATSPPTLGIATFDGLDRYGLAYEVENVNQGMTDILTSRPIDLSNTQDSVYLSFFWQAAGLGEQPENGDSLAVHFHDRDTSWNYAWSVSGVDSTGFEQAMIPITDSLYLQDSFQFRIVAYGSLAGSFDIWNIDYVRLDDERNFDDITFTDPAFTRPHPSLLRDYESIPWFHYNSIIADDQNKQQLNLHYRKNRSNTRTDNLPMELKIYQISHDGVILDAGNGDVTADNGHPLNTEIEFIQELNDFTPDPFPSDEFVINSYMTYGLSGVGTPTTNDTIRKEQVFSNYYAYDDGTAERAYQVADNSGGFIVSRYRIFADNNPQNDVVKGLYIYFLPAEFNAEDNEFKIVIYEDNDGIPGNLLYESDSVYTPQYSATNFYIPYQMDKGGFQVSGNVFMGIKQIKNKRLPIGFDKNNVGRTQTFYGNNTASGLFQSFAKGTIMMRPYLSYDPADLSTPDNPVAEKINVGVYPNPASERVWIDFDEQEKNLVYSLMDLGGRLLQSGKVSAEIEFNSKINTGIYILKIEDPAGGKSPIVTKLMINR